MFETGERNKTGSVLYPSMVTEDGVCPSWCHKPKKGKESVNEHKANNLAHSYVI